MSRPIVVTVPHSLGRNEARARVAAGLDALEQQIAGIGLTRFQKAWSDDRLEFSARALGQIVAGRIDVSEECLRIEVDLPGLLGGFAERVRAKLAESGRLLLEKK